MHYERERCSVGATNSHRVTIQVFWAKCSLSPASERYSRSRHWQSVPGGRIHGAHPRECRKNNKHAFGRARLGRARTDLSSSSSDVLSLLKRECHSKHLARRIASLLVFVAGLWSQFLISQVWHRIWCSLSASVSGQCWNRKWARGRDHKNAWSKPPNVYSMTARGMLARNWLLLTPAAGAWLSYA